MRGAIPHLPNTPLWRGVHLKKAQGKLYLLQKNLLQKQKVKRHS